MSAKQQVKEYCDRFTQLFCSIFPQEKLTSNWFERYSFMQDVVKGIKEGSDESTIIQNTLNNYIANSSVTTQHALAKIGMLIQAGGSVCEYAYQPILKVINKIKKYTMHDNPLYKRYRLSSYTPLSSEERQDLMHSFQILQVFIENKGKIARSDDYLMLAKTALQYRCYALAKNLIFITQETY